MKGEAIKLYLFYHFHPLHSQLDISWVIAAERSPLGIAGSRNRTYNLWYMLLEFTLSTLVLVAAVVRRMLITRVTLGNTSRVLLNLTKKKKIFAMFKDSSSLSMLTQLTAIFSV